MSRQDKATTERNSKTLRELLKRQENKFCADCKRNDPRWASWNLGVFLCIRCSGIHRSMGTHISRVKSVDLDVWTPEQMASVQKWGNRLANLYWEAHLKPGHIPPDHKMDSFIRSKYESGRWAREGSPPSDPSVLDDGAAGQSQPVPPPIPAPASNAPPSRPPHVASGSVSSLRGQAVTNRQPQPHQLLSSTVANRAAQATVAPTQPQAQQVSAQPAQAPAQSTPANDLFTLDFHNPTPPANNVASQPNKDVKQNILSLFSTPSPVTQTQVSGFGVAQNAFGQFGAVPTQVQPQQNVWGGQFGAAQPAQQQPTSFMGDAGVGMWGASSGWNAAPVGVQTQPQVSQQQHQGAGGATFVNTNDIWASPGSTAGGAGGVDPFGGLTTTAPTQKKDDAFGDIWGGFK